MGPLLSLLVLAIIISIVVWGVNQIPLPAPFNFVKILVYCILAIWLVIKGAALLGIAAL